MSSDRPYELVFKLRPDAPEIWRGVFHACLDSTAARRLLGFAEPATVELVMPGGKAPAAGGSWRLAGENSPAGVFVEPDGDDAAVRFDSLDVLAWLTAAGACDMVELN